MPGSDGLSPAAPPTVNAAAQPHSMRTGYRFFPYAAQQSGQWWMLRLNHGFPEHDMYKLFVDGQAAVDLTGSADNPSALVRNVASLTPYGPVADEPALDAYTAAAVVKPVAPYVNYGSEHDDPCVSCSDEFDGMARA